VFVVAVPDLIIEKKETRYSANTAKPTINPAAQMIKLPN
jgi:hypothetical protein